MQCSHCCGADHDQLILDVVGGRRHQMDYQFGGTLSPAKQQWCIFQPVLSAGKLSGIREHGMKPAPLRDRFSARSALGKARVCPTTHTCCCVMWVTQQPHTSQPHPTFLGAATAIAVGRSHYRPGRCATCTTGWSSLQCRPYQG